MHTFWINRNYTYTDTKREYTGSLLKAGEFHWHYDETSQRRGSGSLSWHWGTTFCRLILECGGGDGNDELAVSIGLPFLLSVWFHHTLPRWILTRLPQHHYKVPRYQQLSPFHQDPQIHYGGFIGYDEGSYPESREISLRIHDWALWWRLWMPYDWNSTDPKWRRGSFHFDDFVLGRREYECLALSLRHEAVVTMPEGDYPVEITLEGQRWWRRRWPWWPCVITRQSYAIKSEAGIPFPGKGTTDYNCGDDGLFGTSIDAASEAEACVKFGQIVLEYRRRYGGERCAAEPWPQSPQDRVREHAERVRQRRDDPTAQAITPKEERKT